MLSLERLKDFFKGQTNMWVLVWILFLLNLFTLSVLFRGFSLGIALFLLLLVLPGIIVLKSRGAAEEIPQELVASEEAQGLMQGVRSIGEDIFVEEIRRFTEPLRDSLLDDFSRSLSWLWEEKDAFIARVEGLLNDLYSIPALIVTINEEKAKLLKNLLNNLDSVSSLLDKLRNARENSRLEMDAFLKERLVELQNAMQKEKDIFYDYIHKLLLAQLKNREEGEEEFNAEEYFNTNRLGEQFADNLAKSLENRAGAFQDEIVDDMEDISADLVGKMQNSTLQMVNCFKEIHQNLDQLLRESANGDQMLLQNLNQSRMKTAKIKDQAEEIMLTLAWQDILVEKRWGEIEKQLLQVKEQVNQSVEEDVIEYIRKVIDEEIPSFGVAVQIQGYDDFAKLVIDAELVYQLYSGNKLESIIPDGSYPLLMFMGPVDFLLRKNIRVSQEGINRRKTIEPRNSSGKYEKLFERVLQALEGYNKEFLRYVKDIYPRSFYSYCNNPYLKQRPENLNQAAWALFIELLEEEPGNRELYLVGMLLVMHQIRNKYIQPFKALPRNMEDEGELGLMRYCSYKSIEILLAEEISALDMLGSA